MGDRSTEDEHYCAYPEEQRSARTYTHYDLRLQSGSTAIADWQVICPQADNYPLPNAENSMAGSFVSTHHECAAQCSAFFASGQLVVDAQTGLPTDPPQWIGDNVDCDAYSFRPNVDGDKGLCAYRGYPVDQLAEKSNFLEVRAKRGAPLASPLLPCAASIPHPPTR